MPLKPAYSVTEFLAAFGLGRTKFYELVNAGEIKTRKAGAKTLVLAADAQRWLDSLPEMRPGKTA